MKLITFLLFPIYVFAALHTIQLFVESQNEEIDGQNLIYLPETYPSYYLFIDNSTGPNSIYFYDDVKKNIYYDNKARYYLTLDDGEILQLAPSTPLKLDIDFETGVTSFNGSDKVFAKKDISDPNGFSKDKFAILIGDDINDGIPLEIIAKELET
ncbi:unnamed protein product [Candida verbasci]|uniref:Uncharacterized protein n=1 Tax=Candida verbasci TaxID=1227364 RepID=A0A9W4TYG0_9ASCO|nr:unnamed protein product [Candida verbasci]